MKFGCAVAALRLCGFTFNDHLDVSEEFRLKLSFVSGSGFLYASFSSVFVIQVSPICSIRRENIFACGYIAHILSDYRFTLKKSCKVHKYKNGFPTKREMS